MPQNRVDLVNIFQAVTQTLAQNQQTLNQADEVNHDHGTNMVQTFQTITSSLQQKQGKSASTALTYAAKQLSKSTTSSSGQLYAQGLAQAANQFKGKKVDSKGALDLLQTLIGGGQTPSQSPQAGSGDMLGSLLGQLTSGAGDQPASASGSGEDMLGTILGQLTGGAGTQPSGASPSPQASGDLLSSLLGSMTGSQSSSSGAGGGLDLGDLVNAGMNFMQAKQQGGSTVEALVQAFMSASGMGASARRTQSTSLVINSFLQSLASSAKSR